MLFLHLTLISLFLFFDVIIDMVPFIEKHLFSYILFHCIYEVICHRFYLFSHFLLFLFLLFLFVLSFYLRGFFFIIFFSSSHNLGMIAFPCLTLTLPS